MVEYDRLNFKQSWTDKVKNYLSDHPEEGFEEEDVKAFIKAVVNRHMADEMSTFSKEKFIDELEDELNIS